MNAMKSKIIVLVKKQITYERTNNIVEAQKVYDEILSYCQSNNIDFSNAMNGAREWLRKNDLAFSLNGYI